MRVQSQIQDVRVLARLHEDGGRGRSLSDVEPGRGGGRGRSVRLARGPFIDEMFERELIASELIQGLAVDGRGLKARGDESVDLRAAVEEERGVGCAPGSCRR